MPHETCDECQFDRADYSRNDLVGTLRAVAPMWRQLTEGVDAAVLFQRPAPGVWSAVEYASHSRDITAAMGYLVHLALSGDRPQVGPPPATTPESAPAASISEAIDAIEANAARVIAKLPRLSDQAWQREIAMGDDVVDVDWLAGHAVHDAIHHLRDVGRGLHQLGAGAPQQHGTVVQLNTSKGGVPKTPLATATIDRGGIAGDKQGDRKHHGKPLQALSMWSADVMEQLRAEGHSVHPGAAGENVTVAGIDWSTIRSGVRIRVGTALVEVSAFATPCAKNAQWFSDGNFRRIDHAHCPGSSRAYAWVLEGGTVSAGDTVVVEP